MSNDQDFDFGKFIPGFDFLQRLAQSTSQMLPQMSNWIAPTINLEELEKRIDELKAVHFWLDQNSKALQATLQALEVQKMTLATLKGMNFNMDELANAFQLKAAGGRIGKPGAKTVKAKNNKQTAAAGVIDPLQWWSALTQQFQQIASSTMQEVATNQNKVHKPARNRTPGRAKSVGASTTRGAGTARRKRPAQS